MDWVKRMRGNVQRYGRPFDGSKLWPIFLLLWMKVHEITCQCARRRMTSLQRRFPFDNVMLCSGDIHDHIAKLCEIAPKF